MLGHAPDDGEEELMLAVTLCLRDRRAAARRDEGGGEKGLPSADLSYLQVGFAVLEPVGRQAQQDDEQYVGIGGNGALAASSDACDGVDSWSPLLLLPGQHRVCGTSLSCRQKSADSSGLRKRDACAWCQLDATDEQRARP